MAYAAVISLKQTIQRLLIPSQISVASSSREIIEFAYNEVTSLQEVLKRLDDCSSSSKRLDALDGQIREAVHKLEDVLEFHESNQFLSESESHGDEEVRQEINSFAETLKKMKEEYIKELDNPLPEEEDDDAALSSIDFGVKMVGLSHDFTGIKNALLRRTRPGDFGVFSVVGIAGTGRTFLAKSVFNDFYIGKEQSLDCGAWVTIGPKYQFQEILVSILAQIHDSAGNDELLISKGDEKLAKNLYTSLKGKRYMIVLDDIWDTQIWDYLRSSFPEQDNGSLVLLTTSLKEVALSADSLNIFEMPVYDERFTWSSLNRAVLDVDPCPPGFEEAGQKIAKNCKGLPIPIAKVALFLWKAEKTPEYWNNVAADKENSIFMVADEISEICKIREDMQEYNSFLDDGEMPPTSLALVPLVNPTVNETFKMMLFPRRFFPNMEIISFFGMAGIGKTKLVNEIFEDPSILCHFDHRAWVKLGPKYQSEKILVDILAQIYPGTDKWQMKGDAKLATELLAQLSNKRCLIVLDDVWNKEPLHYLKKLFTDIKGELLVTTRLAKVAKLGEYDCVYTMRLLNKEESWYLFCQKVFGNESCPPQLEKAGKKIAENCEGLPLLILTVADLLSKVEKTSDYWNKLVLEKEISVFMDANNQISKVLSPSYEDLTQYLKSCFLYMGVFPKNYEIPLSKLIKLWCAEGFLEVVYSYEDVEGFVAEFLQELVNRSLVMVCQRSSDFRTKTCSLHSVFWHLSNSEAVKNKFFHALNSYADISIEHIKSQRRLCIRNSILLGIKDVHHSMASISTAHSLLCTGPFHQYPVPIHFGLRLLRVLDALKIRFYEFPVEVVKLIHLRYLSVTCNEKIPASISKLWNLQYLIVSRHMSIKSSGDSSYLPVEIWEMKELKHLQVMGSSLPNPNSGALLPNLLTLLDVSAHSCTKRVLKRIPNLKRLGIQIVLAPDEDGKPFRCLNRISRLRRLESLKCAVVNPELGSVQIVAPPAPLSMFPSSLKKLSLSGFGYPWEYMSAISKLQNLEMLKLRCYAFQGPKWKTDLCDFMKLRFLLIEDTDLVHWEHKEGCLLNLKCLSIKHCYKLEELPSYMLTSVEKIAVVDSNPLAVAWAKQRKVRDFRGQLNLELETSKADAQARLPSCIQKTVDFLRNGIF